MSELEATTGHFIARTRQFLAKDGQASDAALRLLDDPAGAADRFALVVVGERGTGKSSLVNALLGDPDLLPTEPVAATGAYCVLRCGPAFRIHVHLMDGQVLTSPDGAGREWLHRYGGADAEQVPAWIDVELPDPRLEGLQLVDTPGVGGLDSGFGELTMQSLRLAVAVVFVSAAGAPVGRAEVEFLRRASEQVDRVLFVLTKIDGPAGWRKIAAENQAVLSESADRFKAVSTFPVSAKWARDAARASRPELAERLLTDSGVPALWAELQDLARRRDVLRLANRLRAARSAVDVAYRERSEAVARLRDIPAAKSEVLVRRDALEDWHRSSQKWYSDLDIALRRLRRTLIRYLEEQNPKLLKRFDDDPSAGTDENNPAVRRLIAGLGDLQRVAVEMLRTRLTAIAAEVSQDGALGADLPEQLDALVGTDLDVAVKPPSGAGIRPAGEGMTQTQSTYMGTMMAHTVLTVAGAAVIGASNPVGWVLAAGFGAGWAYRAARTRWQAGNAAARHAWAVQAINDAVHRIEQECDERIEEASYLITSTLRRAFPAEIARLQHELEECERAEAQTKDERSRAMAQIEQQRKNLLVYRKQCDERLAALALSGPAEGQDESADQLP